MGDRTLSPGGPTRWSDLGRRALSAIILAPIALWCIWAGAAAFVVLMTATALGLSAEWVGLCGMRLLFWPGVLVPGLIVVAGLATAAGQPGLGIVILLAGFGAVLALTRRRLLASGVLYIGCALVALLWLRGWTSAGGGWDVVFVVLVVWASDIAAYAAGRLFRGPKLAPALSPAKTWSGAAGGLVAAMLVGQVVAGRISLTTAAIALLLAVVCQAGDLMESAIKRHVGVKDSGRLIPGHGGLLDRLDGLLAAAPRGGTRRACGPGGNFLALDRRSVTVLGSTGSIGKSTVNLLLANPDRFRVRALAGGRNVELLAEQARGLGAELAVIADESCLPKLELLLAGSGINAAAGSAAVVAAASMPADWTMAAITGAAGLPSTLAAISRGGAIALANKEALVCAGDVMLRAVKAAGAVLLPVDSEHNAIFQAMAEGNPGAVERIVLTASGGPFRTASLEDMARATPEAALRHPTWSMGAKISIDSATMFNKGLELIEAARLFDMAEDRIGVLVHPQSVVHGIVHWRDGSMLAQLGAPDMRIPIAHALAWPDRLATSSPRLDLAALCQLQFFEPDPVRFPALRLARDALRSGGGGPTILSAANEVAVDAFLMRRIAFTDISAMVEAVLDRLGTPSADTLDAVMELDGAARRAAETIAAAKAA